MDKGSPPGCDPPQERPEVGSSRMPAPKPSTRRPPPGARALAGMVVPSAPPGENEQKLAEQMAMAIDVNASTTDHAAPVPKPRSTVRGPPPAGSMALPGMVPMSGSSGVEASSADGSVHDEKGPPPVETDTAAAALANAGAATMAASPATQMAPNVIDTPTGLAAGAQDAPPSYLDTIQQGGYPQPQQGYNPQQGYHQQPYPPQGYPSQPLYPQAGVSQPGYAPGGNQAMAPVPAAVVTVPPGPQQAFVAPMKVDNWDKGLCSCCSNCGLCLPSTFCSCYIVGKNAEALGHSCCLFCIGAVIPFVSIFTRFILRVEIRKRRGIKGSECGDCCTICFCSFCALTQEANEVRVMKVPSQHILRE